MNTALCSPVYHASASLQLHDIRLRITEILKWILFVRPRGCLLLFVSVSELIWGTMVQSCVATTQILIKFLSNFMVFLAIVACYS